MPFAIGISRVPVLRFVLLNAIGAIAWAGIVASGGYLFGNALEGILGSIRHYEKILFGIVALGGVSVWVLYLLRRHRKEVCGERDIKGQEGV
jgi:membrane protein DedA with SNARE-associated domain